MFKTKAYSLIEAVVTLVLLGVIAALAVPRILSSDTSGEDARAKQSLNAVLEDQMTLFSLNSQFGSAQELERIDNERAFLSQDQASTAVDQISVFKVDNSIFAASVRTADNTCWYLLSNPNQAQENPVWAFKENTPDCKASDASALRRDPSSRTNNGSEANKPLRLN